MLNELVSNLFVLRRSLAFLGKTAEQDRDSLHHDPGVKSYGMFYIQFK